MLPPPEGESGVGTGIWDIWIYRRNLPIVAKQNELQPTPTTKELASPYGELTANLSVTESTTHKLDLPMK